VKKIQDLVFDHPYYFYLVLFAFGLLVYVLSSIDPEPRDSRGRTALYRAAEAGDIQQVVQLLDDGATVDGCDDCKWTPLMRAAQNGHVDIVQSLIESGADVNVMDKGGYTPLMVAAGDDRADVIALLIDHGASLDMQDTTGGWTALIWASREGYIGSVDRLLIAGADKSLKDR